MHSLSSNFIFSRHSTIVVRIFLLNVENPLLETQKHFAVSDSVAKTISITVRKKGHLFISTNFGIVSFRMSQLIIQLKYAVSSGILFNKTNDYIFLMLNDLSFLLCLKEHFHSLLNKVHVSLIQVTKTIFLPCYNLRFFFKGNKFLGYSFQTVN